MEALIGRPIQLLFLVDHVVRALLRGADDAVLGNIISSAMKRSNKSCRRIDTMRGGSKTERNVPTGRLSRTRNVLVQKYKRRGCLSRHPRSSSIRYITRRVRRGNRTRAFIRMEPEKLPIDGNRTLLVFQWVHLTEVLVHYDGCRVVQPIRAVGDEGTEGFHHGFKRRKAWRIDAEARW